MCFCQQCIFGFTTEISPRNTAFFDHLKQSFVGQIPETIVYQDNAEHIQ